jgi:hypothetical protein
MKFAGRVGVVVVLLLASVAVRSPDTASAASVGPTSGAWKVDRLAAYPPLAWLIPGSATVDLVATNEYQLDMDVNADGDKNDPVARIRRAGELGPPFVASFLLLEDVIVGGRFMWAQERPGVDLDGNGRTDQTGYFWVVGDGPWKFIRAGKPYVSVGRSEYESVVVFGKGAGVAVVEGEIDLNTDFDGDGVRPGDFAVTMVASGGRVISTEVFAIPNHIANAAVTALGDGWIGGSLLVRPDGTSHRLATDDGAIVAHFGDAALYRTLGYMSANGPLTLERPGQAALTLPTSAQLLSQAEGNIWLSMSEQASGQDINRDGSLTSTGTVLCKLAPPGWIECLPVSSYDGSNRRRAVALGDGWLFLYGSTTLASGLGQVHYFLVSPTRIEAEYNNAQLEPLGRDRFALVVERPPVAGDVRLSVDLYVIENRVVSTPVWSGTGSGYSVGVTGLGDGRAFFTINRDTYLLTGTTLRDLNGLVDQTFYYTGFSFTVPMPGGPVFVGMHESASGADLNGDGDFTDIVAHVVDESGVTNLGIAIGSEWGMSENGRIGVLGPDKVLLRTTETWQNVDLDGDGKVLHASAVFEVSRRVPPPVSDPPATSSGFLQPARVLDTRPGGQVGYSGAKPSAGQTVEVQIAGVAGVPASGVRSVALNVTVADATDAGFVTVWGDGARPDTSNVNIERAGQTVPNLVVVPVGADGKVRLFTDGGAHLLADVAAWWGDGSGLQPLTPSRLLDTRGATKPAPGSVTDVQVAGRGGAPASGSMVAVLNVTVTAASGPGFVTVWGDGSRPDTSNLNAAETGQTIANLVVVPVGADGKVHLYTDAGTHLLVDLTGMFVSGVAVDAPSRVLDTRSGAKPKPGSVVVVPLGLSAGTKAVVLNVTATRATGPGYITVWPDGTQPTSSNLNIEYADQTVPNLVIVPVGADGSIRIFTDAGTDLLVDVLGRFS